MKLTDIGSSKDLFSELEKSGKVELKIEDKVKTEREAQMYKAMLEDLLKDLSKQFNVLLVAAPHYEKYNDYNFMTTGWLVTTLAKIDKLDEYMPISVKRARSSKTKYKA